MLSFGTILSGFSVVFRRITSAFSLAAYCLAVLAAVAHSHSHDHALCLDHPGPESVLDREAPDEACVCSCEHADLNGRDVTQEQVAALSSAAEGECPLCEFLTLKLDTVAVTALLHGSDPVGECYAAQSVLGLSDSSHAWRERAPPV